MPRIFVPPEKLQGARATLDVAAHRHLIKVLRLAPGAALQVFDGKGTEIEARIEAVGKASVDIALGEQRHIPAPACAITLLVSPPRGERMDLIVQKTTELGVGRIVPVVGERGMVKPSPHQRRRWQTIAEEAARQSGRADVPEIGDGMALASGLAQAAAAGGSRFLLWEAEHGPSLACALASRPRAVVLLVGPEGGFAAGEVALARAAGFVSAGLGPRILRSETAAIVAVALAQASAGGLGENTQ
jgi:16S rRNA (uracil1498-N3)-methyltransferase